MYDQHGKDGIYTNGHTNGHHHHRTRRNDDYDPFSGFGYAFRDPDEVFREFFNGSTFGDIFSKENIFKCHTYMF